MVQNKVEDKEGGRATTTQERHHVDGVAWVDALQAKVEKRNVKRMSSLLPILRGMDEGFLFSDFLFSTTNNFPFLFFQHVRGLN